MALFTTPFDEAVEEKIVPEGEYNLRITSAQMKEAKSGRQYLLVSLDNVDEPNGATVFHMVNGLMPTDEGKTRQMLSNMADEFFSYFNLDPMDELTLAELRGRECRALLVQEEYEGRISNKIKRLI